MWAEPPPPAATDEPVQLLVRFVLAGEGPHALSPGLHEGPALCGQEEPGPGWALSGFTSADLDRIGCEGCRRVAGQEASPSLKGRRA
jgi:hypothetical protein